MSNTVAVILRKVGAALDSEPHPHYLDDKK